MDFLKEYLESSSVHGFLYVSKAKHFLAKILWLCIVIIGFTSATLMISSAFKNWEDSPIKTNIETLPISQLNFPRITVCPPKNSYTSLNIDIVESEKKTLDNKTRVKLYEEILERVDEKQMNRIFSNFSLMNESGRLFNWFEGKSNFSHPSYYPPKDTMFYKIVTMNSYGEISSKYFGENFNKTKLNDIRQIIFMIEVWVPEIMLQYDNSTFSFEINQVAIRDNDIESGFDDFHISGFGYLSKQQNNFSATITDNLPKYVTFFAKRKLSMSDIDELDYEKMPGFKLNWKFSSSSLKYSNKYISKETLEFQRFTNIVKSSLEFTSEIELWKIVKDQRKNWTSTTLPKKLCEHFTEPQVMKENSAKIVEILKITQLQNFTSVSENVLELSAKMFILLNSCSYAEKPWMKTYENLLKSSSLKEILLTLSRLRKNDNAAFLFERLTKILHLKQGNVHKMFAKDENHAFIKDWLCKYF